MEAPPKVRLAYDDETQRIIAEQLSLAEVDDELWAEVCGGGVHAASLVLVCSEWTHPFGLVYHVEIVSRGRMNTREGRTVLPACCGNGARAHALTAAQATLALWHLAEDPTPSGPSLLVRAWTHGWGPRKPNYVVVCTRVYVCVRAAAVHPAR
jgi:hypothetical protein